MELGAVTPPPDSADAVRRRRNRRRAVALLLCGIGAVSVALYRGRLPRVGAPEGPRDAVVERPARIVPDSVRIKVEVVNATDIRGLGRLATAWLTRSNVFRRVANSIKPFRITAAATTQTMPISSC